MKGSGGSTKSPQPQATKSQKSVVVVTSKTADLGGEGEQIEVAAQITVPDETGWAWIVLLASFLMTFVIDGGAFTYGAMLTDIAKSLKIDVSIAALINSVEVAIYFIGSPIASALINRFGFRTVAMLGSIICSIGLFATYVSENFVSVLIFFGIMTGLGDSFINMSASLIIGFYFEKRRSIAMAISTGGSSVGIMTMYPIHSQIVKLAGWKNIMILQAGLHGFLYFLSLTFRPLLSLTVIHTEDEGNLTRTVTILPTMNAESGKRTMGAVSNVHFPTAAAIFQGTAAVSSQTAATTSAKPGGVSRMTLQANNTVSTKQLKQMQSIASKVHLQDTKAQTRTEITIKATERKKKKCCGILFDWEEDLPESRPMYRDDTFYQGKVESLPAYQKSVAGLREDERTGLEYQLAVSRAITVNDLQERRGVCTTAVRRVLVSMMDPALLKKKSFMLFCLNGLLIYTGVLVPFVFIQDRNSLEGISAKHCELFVSVMSFSNLLGRFIFNAMATKIEPVYLYIFCLLAAGVSNIFSDISYSLYFQYGYCVSFGGFISVISGLRSIVLVSLYGLENLTNATGVFLMFVGVGNLISTPLAGLLKNMFGYKVSFYVSGVFIIVGGLVCMPVKCFVNSENRSRNKNKKVRVVK